MTTRRALLSWAGGAAGLAVLGGCRLRGREAGSPAAPASPGDVLFVTTSSGLAVVDAATGERILPAPAALATAEWHLVTGTEPTAAGLRLVTRDPRTGQAVSEGPLRDRLEARVISPDGRFVALTRPAGGTPAAPYRPVGRERTTVVVAESGRERHRLDLPGNIEPEAFSPDGAVLYVLDYLPPARPDRYRVRAIELATGQFRPLLTRQKTPVPAGAEEEMRGDGRQAVYDATRKMLFTLYTHQPDHEHTRDLLAGGARADAPQVHAFVHTLQLDSGMAYCIDLPAPFGHAAPTAHTIVAQPDGARLYVVDVGSGSLAHIDSDQLTMAGVSRFSGADTAGEAFAVTTMDGRLVVAAGTLITSLSLGHQSTVAEREWTLSAPARGLALGDHGRLYIGQPDEVLACDLATARELARTPVADLVALRHVMPATR
jgi:hypothetical protein